MTQTAAPPVFKTPQVAVGGGNGGGSDTSGGLPSNTQQSGSSYKSSQLGSRVGTNMDSAAPDDDDVTKTSIPTMPTDRQNSINDLDEKTTGRNPVPWVVGGFSLIILIAIMYFIYRRIHRDNAE